MHANEVTPRPPLLISPVVPRRCATLILASLWNKFQLSFGICGRGGGMQLGPPESGPPTAWTLLRASSARVLPALMLTACVHGSAHTISYPLQAGIAPRLQSALEMHSQLAQALHRSGNGTHVSVQGPGTPGQRLTTTQPARVSQSSRRDAASHAPELREGVPAWSAMTALEPRAGCLAAVAIVEPCGASTTGFVAVGVELFGAAAATTVANGSGEA